MSIKKTHERAAQLGLTRIDNSTPPVSYTTPQPGDTPRIENPDAFIEQVIWNTPHSK